MLKQLVPVLFLPLLTACSTNQNAVQDAGPDASPDAGDDAGTDPECPPYDTFDQEECPDVSDITDCVVYVDVDSSIGGDGRSWDTALTDLQEGLDLATCGVLTTDYCQQWQVWAAEGSYYAWRDCEELDTFWLRSNVALYGGFVGDETALAERDPAAHATVLDGREGPDGESTVWNVIIANMADDVRLDGLTVRKGMTPVEDGARSGAGVFLYSSAVVESCIFEDNQGWWSGGLFVDDCDIHISDTVFRNNLAELGAGLAAQYSHITISDSTFESNSSTETGWGSAVFLADSTDATVIDTNFVNNQGTNSTVNTMQAQLDMSGCNFEDNVNTATAAVFIQNTHAVISDTTFLDNETTGAPGTGGGLLFDGYDLVLDNVQFQANAAEFGGGLFHYSEELDLIDSTFVDNSADIQGGAIYSQQGSITASNCIFTGNTTGSSGGAAVLTTNESSTVTDCLFVDNSSDDIGGALSTGANESLVVEGCTFTGNSAATAGSTIDIVQETLVMTDCILWDEGDSHIYVAEETDPPIVTYSDVRGGYTGEGNIDADPLFVDPDGGDYCLQAASPCIGTASDAGDMGYCPYEGK